MRISSKGDKLSALLEFDLAGRSAARDSGFYPPMESADLYVTEYLATFIGERESEALRREARVLLTSTVLTLQTTFSEVEFEIADFSSTPQRVHQENERQVILRDLSKQVLLRSDDIRLLDSVSLALKAQLSAQILSLNYVAKARQAKREWEVSADLLQHEIYLIDASLNLQRLNHAAAQRMGSAPQSLVGKPFDPELAGGLNVLQAALPSSLGVPLEYTLGHENQYFLVRVFRVHWGYDRHGYILMRHDCTSDVIGQRAQLRSERMAGLGQVSVGLAHEINNPLGVILAAANSLQRRYKTDPQVQNLAGIITSEVERCRRITHALLDYGRSPERKGSLVNVGDLLRKVPERFQATHPNAPVQVHVAADLFVNGNEDDLVRLFTNLTSNAVEASQPGQPVVISLVQETTKALVSIANEGPPIPKEIASRMFEPFYTTKTTGTGLGLSFAVKIVELLQGQLGYSREQGSNVFRVWLPLGVVL
jgi:signal transduction histidine kinase